MLQPWNDLPDDKRAVIEEYVADAKASLEKQDVAPDIRPALLNAEVNWRWEAMQHETTVGTFVVLDEQHVEVIPDDVDGTRIGAYIAYLMEKHNAECGYYIYECRDTDDLVVPIQIRTDYRLYIARAPKLDDGRIGDWKIQMSKGG